MKHLVLVLGACLFVWAGVQAQSSRQGYDSLRIQMLKRQDVQEDFRYLRRALEETHPGLYRYHSRQEMDHKMDSLYARLSHDMPFQEYYLLLASLISDIRCGHTTVLPARNWQQLFADPPVFPYNMVFLENGVYLTACLTADTLIHPGFELLAINGRSIDSVKLFLFSHLPGDGYIESIKRQMLSDNFKLFYALLAEQSDSFSLVCKDLRGTTIQAKVPAVRPSAANAGANPVNRELLRIYAPLNKLNQEKPKRLEIHAAQNAAVLTIRNFGGNVEQMRTFMDTSLQRLKTHNIRHLIIDLRDNGGGWDRLGEELFTYLIGKPTRYYRRMHMITDSSGFLKFSSLPEEERQQIKNALIREADGTYTVKETANTTLALQYPKPNRFTGKVYFLINGGSGSATSEFTAAAQSNRLGVFAGEESGGNYTGGNGGEFLSFTLPKTGIQAGIPLLYNHNAVSPPAQPGRGTLPDHHVPHNITDILKGKDIQLQAVLDLISKQSS